MRNDTGFSFSDIVAKANDAVIVAKAADSKSAKPKIVYVNAAFCRLSGYSEKEAMGKAPGFMDGPDTDPETRAKIADAIKHGRHMRTRLLQYAKDGTTYWVDVNIMPLFGSDGEVTHTAAIQRDVTADVLREQEVLSLATTDDLTGAKNRRHFMERAELEVHRLRRHRVPFSVVLLDLDHFKRVNDTHGHQAGDDVLKEAVRRWQLGRRPFDTLGRLGGEEFAILLPGADAAAAMTVAERLRAVIADTPFDTIDGPIDTTVSIGVAEAEDADQTIEGTLGRADAALYHSKHAGRNRATKASPIPTAKRKAAAKKA
jgi:diguanylate cyclase (GGDEF)-like protein/PAS domain S-box-containing protein